MIIFLSSLSAAAALKAALRRNDRDIIAGKMTLEIGSGESILFPDDSADD